MRFFELFNHEVEVIPGRENRIRGADKLTFCSPSVVGKQPGVEGQCDFSNLRLRALEGEVFGVACKRVPV